VPGARRFPPHRPLRALAKKAGLEVSRPPRTSASPATDASDEVEGDIVFASAAARLGVETLPDGPGRVGAPRQREAPAPKPEPEFVVHEEDGWVEGYRGDLGARVLARVRGTPRATLDLHGARVASARRRLATFLARAPASGTTLVLIIVGKGRHSPGGHAVLASEIGEWLSTGSAARRVLAFRTAPPELGGSGGVLVLLDRARG
jgi:DNA-nicking Smr family endonuclease